MSTIYIQEPPTNGKVLLETTVGDIDIELWAREAPKACRNFVQLCMESYYDDTLFHRVVKGFIVQGGDPTGTGTGGESIYGRTFKDEFHTRLRFVRRGLVAMANAGKDDNGSQFFFTMASCPELQNKHTIFGKVAGDTLYNMLKLEDGLVDHNDRPHYPHKILSTKVLLNPFTDIVPRILPKKDVEKGTETKTKSKGTKNFHLLSFGDEAEEDEEETNIVAKEYRGKSKSSHDLANDPNLSSLPAVETKDDQHDSDDEHCNVEKKLKKDETARKKPTASQEEIKEEDDSDSEQKSKRQKIEEIKKEFKRLKKELVTDKQKEGKAEQNNEVVTSLPENEALAEYYASTKKYVETKKTIKANKTTSHEVETITLLERFQAKLQSAAASRSEDDDERKTDEKKKKMVEVGEEDEDEDDDEGWLTHTLQFESHDRLAKDASVANEDTFEIHDPRNPINQRRREVSKAAMNDNKRRK